MTELTGDEHAGHIGYAHLTSSQMSYKYISVITGENTFFLAASCIKHSKEQIISSHEMNF